MRTDEVEMLLAEDDEADAELTVTALRGAHVLNRIHVARDGQEALDFLESRRNGPQGARLRLILLDLKMPRVDGLTVLRRIKQDPQLRTIPVVVLTSSAQDPDLRAAYELGANSYIQKPADFDQFRATVQQLGLYWLLVNRPPQIETRDSERAVAACD